MLGMVEGKSIRGRQRVRWLGGITNSKGMTLSRLRKIVKDREAGVLLSMGLQRVRHDLETEQQQRTLIL